MGRQSRGRETEAPSYSGVKPDKGARGVGPWGRGRFGRPRPGSVRPGFGHERRSCSWVRAGTQVAVEPCRSKG
jgi:hypothetical protein